MKNVLVIVYYFPPMGGSGVQRPLKFVKYLREFGWNPIVLCPGPGAYHVFDESLQQELDELEVEVHRVEGNTPFHLLGKTRPENLVTLSDRKARLFRKFSRLLYYPDNKRGWISPAVKKGEELIKSEDIDLIFSSAPPFSNHIVASQLKEKTKVPVVLDYRDSWLDNHFMTGLFGWQKAIMKKQERLCLELSDAVIGLDEFMLMGISENHPDVSLKTHIVSHGFDPDDLKKKNKSSLDYKKGKLNILYSGLFYESNQPDIFLKAIAALLKERKIHTNQIHLHFQGGLDYRINNLINSLGLKEIVSDYGYVNHDEAVANLKNADLLWMISNFSGMLKQIKSGKLFEYIGTGNPILGLVHQGAASGLLEEYQAGFFVPPDDEPGIKNEFEKIFKLWRTDSLPDPDKVFISKFNRRTLTSELATIFNVISGK